VRTGIFFIRRKSRDTDQARANGKSDLVVCNTRGENTFLPYFDNIALTARYIAAIQPIYLLVWHCPSSGPELSLLGALYPTVRSSPLVRNLRCLKGYGWIE
jgi:hypothetical protein